MAVGPTTNTYVFALAVSGTNLFAGTWGGVFLSTNNGTRWTAVNSGMSSTNVSSLAVSGTNLFAGTYDAGVFLSTNNGTSWTAVDSGLTYAFNVDALAVSGTNLFAGTERGGVFLTTNNATSWTAVNSGLAFNDLYVPAFAVSGTNLFAGTYGGGVFLSTNNGASWTAVNSGLTTPYVSALAVLGKNLFAGTDGVWERPLAEMLMSVKDFQTNLPTQFNLRQNYPNPFNPSTNISFDIPSKAFVSLKIFDALGREVAVLASEELPTGSYTLRWNAGNMSSGIFFCRLQAGRFIKTKRLLLLK
jgi:hypothetical protein